MFSMFENIFQFSFKLFSLRNLTASKLKYNNESLYLFYIYLNYLLILHYFYNYYKLNA